MERRRSMNERGGEIKWVERITEAGRMREYKKQMEKTRFARN